MAVSPPLSDYSLVPQPERGGEAASGFANTGSMANMHASSSTHEASAATEPVWCLEWHSEWVSLKGRSILECHFSCQCPRKGRGLTKMHAPFIHKAVIATCHGRVDGDGSAALARVWHLLPEMTVIPVPNTSMGGYSCHFRERPCRMPDTGGTDYPCSKHGSPPIISRLMPGQGPS